MSQIVVHAQLIDRLGWFMQRSTTISDIRDRYGVQKVDFDTRCAQLRPENFRPQQHASWLNLEHDRELVVGRLAAIERAASGLWATWTGSQTALLQLTAPVYVSAEIAWRGTDSDATDIELRGAAIVASTAATVTQPATILAGDLSRKGDRDQWRVAPDIRARLERAAETLRRRRAGDDLVVVHDELAAQAMRREVEAENRRHQSLWVEQARQLERGSRIEHSGPRGRVISVT